MKKVLLIFMVFSICASCGGRQRAKTQATTGEGDSKPAKAYVIPNIPSIYSGQEEIAEYISQHYWDNFDFSDTTNIDNAEYTEQAFTNYVMLVKNIPEKMAEGSIKTLFVKAAADRNMFRYFAEISEKYFYEPNSPYRDDELYIFVLEAVLADPSVDQWERIRPQEQLRMALKNRVGTPAADFRYTLSSGARGTLYGIKAQYTLIFINNPGCAACKDIQDQIMSSPLLVNMMNDGMLAILAVYPDEDLKEWHDYASKMPHEWINSYDKELQIKKGELYNLQAIPTIYLLDSDKKVILKDVVSVPLIEQTFIMTNNDNNRR